MDDNYKAEDGSPRRVNDELKKENSEDFFISFDINPFADLREDAVGGEKTLFAYIPKRKLEKRTISLRKALVLFAKEFFSKPQNYAYIGILFLLVVFIVRIRPLSMGVKERLIVMIPPELELLKPPNEPESEPPPEKKIEREIEKPKTIQKPEEQKVSAVESEEVKPDLPSAFGDTKGGEAPPSLSQLGKVYEATDLDETLKVVFKVEPKYPELARRAGKEGFVVLRILITRTGEVEKVIVTSAPDKLGFAEAAVEAVKQWKFAPPTVNGEPVDVWSTLPIRFKLE